MMNEESPSRAEIAVTHVMAEIDAGRIEVYRNILRQPYIFLRIPDRPQGSHYLYDEQVRCFIAIFIWDRCHVVLHGQEITRILTVLAGLSTKMQRVHLDDPAILMLLLSEPVAAVAYEFMYSYGTAVYEARADQLWKVWRQLATERGLLQLGKKRFPGGHNVLTRALRQLEQVLAAIGIELTIRRSNGCQITLRRRSDDNNVEPSREPSAPTSPNGKELPPKDDKEARIARLTQKKLNGANQKGAVDDHSQSP